MRRFLYLSFIGSSRDQNRSSLVIAASPRMIALKNPVVYDIRKGRCATIRIDMFKPMQKKILILLAEDLVVGDEYSTEKIRERLGCKNGETVKTHITELRNALRMITGADNDCPLVSIPRQTINERTGKKYKGYALVGFKVLSHEEVHPWRAGRERFLAGKFRKRKTRKKMVKITCSHAFQKRREAFLCELKRIAFEAGKTRHNQGEYRYGYENENSSKNEQLENFEELADLDDTNGTVHSLLDGALPLPTSKKRRAYKFVGFALVFPLIIATLLFPRSLGDGVHTTGYLISSIAPILLVYYLIIKFYFSQEDANFHRYLLQILKPVFMRQRYENLLESSIEVSKTFYGATNTLKPISTSVIIAFFYCSVSFLISWLYGFGDLGVNTPLIHNESSWFGRFSFFTIFLGLLWFSFYTSKKVFDFSTLPSHKLMERLCRKLDKTIPIEALDRWIKKGKSHLWCVILSTTFACCPLLIGVFVVILAGTVLGLFSIFNLDPKQSFLALGMIFGVFLGVSTSRRSNEIESYDFDILTIPLKGFLIGAVIGGISGIGLVKGGLICCMVATICGVRDSEEKHMRYRFLLLCGFIAFFYNLVLLFKATFILKTDDLVTRCFEHTINSSYYKQIAGYLNDDMIYNAFPVLFFLIFMPIINGFWDWLSLEASRNLGAHLLKNLKATQSSIRIWAIIGAHVLLDCIVAVLLLCGLAFTFVFLLKRVQDHFFSAITNAPFFEINSIFEAFRSHDSEALGTWVSLLLASTLVPTMLHFVFSALLGISMLIPEEQILKLEEKINAKDGQEQFSIFFSIHLPILALVLISVIWCVYFLSTYLKPLLLAVIRSAIELTNS